MRILVVDDELVSRRKMVKIMEGVGECEEAQSGIEAVSAFQKALGENRPFDMMTLDIAMPGKDGMEALADIREIEGKNKINKNLRLKVLMVTASSDKDTIITCIQAGCDDYIVKPFDRGKVVEKLHKIGFSDLGAQWGKK